MAYDLENERTEAMVLHFQLKALEFSSGYTNLFSEPRNPSVSLRKLFGSPYHSVVSHMPVMYRYICLRSVAAEAEERQFCRLR